jgi:formylglycine-generating enzyme required for sulfatase activity
LQNSSSNPGTSIRTEAPRIPDHEMLRCIGKGSYGEVWLARSLTGSLRAAKVVRREDFELDRTFEREFEGIMRFEPISRNHPGLVHILHVGRNDEEGFYYYLMELGDDRETGSRVEVGDYEPRTMGTDRSVKKRLSVQECVDHGIVLADALAHLHEHDLTHRDIKPSNIIFVNGKPKLADIGLVAATGQMTFVGTEGFVPPEGPGTAAADIYSLGMVLYELSTGNDRLQFPEVPDDLGDFSQRPMWRALNEVICKACAPQVKKRYSSARQMADALRGVARLRGKRRRWVRRLVTMPLVTAMIGFGIVTWRHGGTMPWPPGMHRSGPEKPFVKLTGSVSLTSEPTGAEIIYEGKTLSETTPATVSGIAPGTALFTLRRRGFEDAPVSVSGVSPGTTVTAQHTVMRFYDPPRAGVVWKNSLGMEFDPRPTDHISRLPVTIENFEEIVRDVMVSDSIAADDGTGQEIYLVRVPPAEAVRFCDLLAAHDAREGYLPGDYCYRPLVYEVPPDPEAVLPMKDLICFRLIAEKQGSVQIETDPPGAAIFSGGKRLEVTPFHIAVHRTGPVKFALHKEGYDDIEVEGTVESGKTLTISKTLTKTRTPVPHQDWTNSLGMEFVDIPGETLLVSKWETRVKDYAEFAKATSRGPGLLDLDKNGQPDEGQTPEHPVVNVTRADAVAYCQWLTEHERAARWLSRLMEYRLPTDSEWSLAAGRGVGDLSYPNPASRQTRQQNVYPWLPVGAYPPPMAEGDQPAAANLGDLAALQAGDKSANPLNPLSAEQANELRQFKYNDGKVFTAPVGSFRPNEHELFDMSGNVWEFVSDDFGVDPGKTKPEMSAWAVTRGASWKEPVTKNKQYFWTHFRRAVAQSEEAAPHTGFRVVISPVK